MMMPESKHPLASSKVLVVDDERPIREMVCLALRSEGYACQEAASAHEAEQIIAGGTPDILLLDWMMPGLSGIEFARKLRRNPDTKGIPIIMLTARTEEDDMIRGLDSGADDYLTKPFSTRELSARVRTLLRRASTRTEDEVLKMENLILDPASHRVYANNNLIEMGPTEYRLLQFLLEHAERAFTREQLLNQVWGPQTYIEERTVDVHIRRLRKALQPSGHDKFVQTVRGTGYRLSRHSQ